jgi:phosphatidylinositol dimannoside acyltransferase
MHNATVAGHSHVARAAMLKVYGLKAVTVVVCFLPRGLCYASARAIGSFLAVLPTTRRRALTFNISIARGESNDSPGVRRDVRRALQHAMLNYVDLFRMARPDARAMVEKIEVADWRPFDEANALGKGVILVSAHLGNFDMVVQKLPMHGVRALIPVQPVTPPELLDEFRRHRTALGTEIVPVGMDTFKLLSAHVRSGGTVVIVSDRDIQHTGYEVELFGHRTRLPQAAIMLALRTGAPVLGAFGYRHADNRITARFARMSDCGGADFSTRRNPSLGKHTFKEDLDAGMRALAGMIEIEIRRDPGQWVVQQDVFATDVQGSAIGGAGSSAPKPRLHALKAMTGLMARRHAMRSR